MELVVFDFVEYRKGECEMSSLVYYKENDFEIEDIEAFRQFTQKAQNQIAILTYGNNLDERAIDGLFDTYLKRDTFGEQGEITVRFDTYDANVKSRYRNGWCSEIPMDASQFIAFEAAVHRLNGTHVRIHHRVRGHFEVVIEGKEISTSVYKTRDCSKVYREPVEGRYLFFIDEESEDNHEIRDKMHLLPDKLQFLSLPVTLPFEEREVYVRDWIKRILRVIREGKM